eukprot:gnl/MRDRNA2_/MRDRNA2_78527_c0_seq1.p1 gnl/MRDRNA2_/MRDRNA2_78527_c0~~gnl/MRDRNA2_/MRDRNA2_78527_c0_seq1.p1  ORF type:complete len:120 (+),score=15.17 gnl/MRDRNA2_/MRDRNA2_78527_c0_seq1:152-511(+)
MGAHIVQLAKPLGPVFVRAAVYFIAMALSMFMNNSATIAIMGPMAINMSKDTGLTVQSLLFCMVFGAGACFTTPLGYQTNMMVMKDGGYTFADFLKFGVVIQLLHMCATVFLYGSGMTW